MAKKKKTGKSSKAFTGFNSLSAVDKIAAKKMIKNFSESLDGEIKEGFDEAINDLYNGKDSFVEVEELTAETKELKKKMDKFDSRIEKILDAVDKIEKDIDSNKIAISGSEGSRNIIKDIISRLSNFDIQVDSDIKELESAVEMANGVINCEQN